MPLQEPLLKAVRMGFGWPLPPRFPDVRGLLTEVIRDVTGVPDDWMWDSSGGPHVAAWNEEQRFHIWVRPQRLDLFSEEPDPTRLANASGPSLRGCLDVLGLDKATDCEVAAAWILPAEDADAAAAALEGWMFVPDLRTTLGPLGGRPKDIELEFRFEADPVRTTFGIEPVTDEQAAHGGFFLSEYETSEFPPGALLAEVDRMHKADFAPADAIAKAQEHLTQVIDQAEKLLATVGAVATKEAKRA